MEVPFITLSAYDTDGWFLEPGYDAVGVPGGVVIGVPLGAVMGAAIGASMAVAVCVNVGAAIGASMAVAVCVNVGAAIGASMAVAVCVNVGAAIGASMAVAVCVNVGAAEWPLPAPRSQPTLSRQPGGGGGGLSRKGVAVPVPIPSPSRSHPAPATPPFETILTTLSPGACDLRMLTVYVLAGIAPPGVRRSVARRTERRRQADDTRHPCHNHQPAPNCLLYLGLSFVYSWLLVLYSFFLN